MDDGTNNTATQIRIRGKNRTVPSAVISGETVVVANRWPSISSLKDEEFYNGNALDDADSFIGNLRQSRLRADLFTFVQKFPDMEPRFRYYIEWDNVAALPVTSYDDWLNNQINGNMRRIVRRSFRRGISVEKVEFTDALVQGIVEIYNETPVRQQRPFWHYGKDFPTVKNEAGTYLDRSIFLGAHLEGKLVGFMKIVSVGKVARMMHILSMEAHMDKLPTNALIAKAVAVCAEAGFSYLTYGKYSYGNMSHTSLAEFKNRNGFRKCLIPRYYIPLTQYGKLALKLGIHHDLKSMVPESVFRLLVKTRAAYSSLLRGNRAPSTKSRTPETDDESAESKQESVAG